MRLTFTAAVALALAASPASAASLKGKSFAIDKTTANQQPLTSAFVTPGGFAVSLSEDTDGDKSPDTVSLLRFKATGKPDGKKALVAKGKPGPARFVATIPSGGLALKGAASSLVSYVDLRGDNPLLTGGLFGQVMDGDKTSGKELELDAETKQPVVFGMLAPLKTGGFASWTTTDFLTRKPGAAGRFVATNGKPAKEVIDLTRANSQFSGVQKHRDGFIAQWLEFDSSLKNATLFARNYDGKGKPASAEVKLAGRGPTEEVAYTTALALDDGNIVVLSSVALPAGARIEGQLYDGDWKKIGKSKVLVKSMVDRISNVHPLPGGDFIIGYKVADGAKDVALAYTRFSQQLKSVGATARIASVSKPELSHLLALGSGDVVVFYTSAGKKLSGQLIKP